ncbi:MAG TPA: hypothetical protein VNZ86_18605 [Bacteroidia bacterium]|jgi:hypothetical protein|nr:hypothetical protein [Bacteroidia bacterium]
MQETSFHQKRDHLRSEKKLDKKHYVFLLVLLGLNFLFYTFMNPLTIGHDERYTLYIIALPLVLGIVSLAWYRREFIRIRIGTAQTAMLKILTLGFYLLEGIFFSALTFVLIAHASWSYINKTAASGNPTEVIRCKIDKFTTGRYPSIDFKFHDRYERIRTNYATVKEYKSETEKVDYDIVLTVQKGIWNYYLLKDWEIEEEP